jgi:hypothetical protein
MNIAQAKEIPLHIIVEALGGRYVKTDRKGVRWYHSPFRPEERTPSFTVDERKNHWWDYGLPGRAQGNGGDIIDLWCQYHHLSGKDGISEALQALETYSTIPYSQPRRINTKQTKPATSPAPAPETPRFENRSICNLARWSMFMGGIKI